MRSNFALKDNVTDMVLCDFHICVCFKIAAFVTRMCFCWRMFPQDPGLVHLGSCPFKNEHCPSRNLSENYFLTNLVAQVVEFRSCKGYFPP